MRLLFALMAVSLVAQPVKSGVDVDAIDKTCKPCEDFWRFTNGGMLEKNPIPAARSRWGTLDVLTEGNQERLRVILETASVGKAPAGSNERKIGDLYAACMDSGKRQALGLAPIQEDLDRIAKISTREELKAAMLRMLATGSSSPFTVTGNEDSKDTSRVVAYLGVAGVSLQDREYYFRDDARTKRIRDEFAKHVTRLLALGGIDRADAGQLILAFETENAKVMKTLVERRDPYGRYNKFDLAGLNALSPNFAWGPVLRTLGVAESTPVIVSEPKVIENFDKQLTGAPLETWKLWLQWRVLKDSAALLTEALEAEDFAFDERVMRGVKEPQPRWQRCTSVVDRSLGEALGELFVKKHFPTAAKKRMGELVENLRAAMKEELEKADWLEADTRKSAILKLNSFEAKIGYPARWRDYSAVVVKRDAYHASVRSAALSTRAYRLSKIGKPTEKNDWGMTPPTVNAYYRATKNEIVFPAGILQPPLFDLDADDAANYGAIGAVIGHEMGHGFDDQGSKFDFSGNLKNWWTAEDRKKFEARAGCVIDQFNTLDVGEGLRHNGRLVVGEAMGDLGGLQIAYRAYQRSLQGKAAPVLDGYTGDQRFFLAFARVWATVYRPESLRVQLQTNPHPVGRFRANGTLMNMPEFHKAFQCKLGDAMVRPPEKQCKLW